jgi:hypothetical protein
MGVYLWYLLDPAWWHFLPVRGFDSIFFLWCWQSRHKDHTDQRSYIGGPRIRFLKVLCINYDNCTITSLTNCVYIYICILCSIILSSRFPPKKNRSLPSSPCFFADHSEVPSPNKPPRDQRRTIPSWTLLTSREGHEADDFSAKLGVLTVI